MDIGGTSKAYYAWGLNVSSNNIVEAYTMWKELKIVKGMALQSIIVVGDSNIITNHVVHNS